MGDADGEQSDGERHKGAGGARSGPLSGPTGITKSINYNYLNY